MILVVAGIIKNSDNKIFIAKRNYKKNQGGLWEFPGGKVELNETYEEALIREIKEELDMNIKIDSYFGSSIHKYDDREIKLIVYKCSIISKSYKLLEHEDSKWVAIDELKEFDFAENDKYFVSKLESD